MKKRILSILCSAIVAAAAVLPFTASADWEHIGYMGDVNNDGVLDTADLVTLSKHLHGIAPLTDKNSYFVDESYVGINGGDGFQAGEYFVTADIDQNGEIDVFDLIQLRKAIISNNWQWVWKWQSVTDVPTEPLENYGEYIGAPVNDVFKFMPSQGTGRMVIIYADFADTKFSYEPSMEEVEKIAFGEEDTSSPLYPWESASAFYKRSSKGAMELSGKAYRYTAKYPEAHYQKVRGQKELLTEACSALNTQINFKDFDGNKDGFIDTIAVIVPGTANRDTWWPASVQFNNDKYYYDGMDIGHMITGNCQIDGPDDYSNFTTTLLHETGHCMGLPDYYLYGISDDFDGMHGTAGSELMDDTGGDFSCVSKLQLGWYKTDQVQVYEPSSEPQSFTLYNAQSDKGNTVIIPCGELDGRYHGEFMMIEYTTKDANNSQPPWHVSIGNGIRVYHVDTTLYDNGFYLAYRYTGTLDFNDNYNGRRVIRIIDDVEKDNLYRTGDVIDGNILGFHWYDGKGRQTIDTGLVIEVGENNGDSYQITIKNNQ